MKKGKASGVIYFAPRHVDQTSFKYFDTFTFTLWAGSRQVLNEAIRHCAVYHMNENWCLPFRVFIRGNWHAKYLCKKPQLKASVTWDNGGEGFC